MAVLSVGVLEKPIGVLSEEHRTFEERASELEQIRRAKERSIDMEKQSPYSNWYQFNREHTKEMIWLATEHPKAQAILLFLLDQMDNYNAVMCSYQVIQEALSIGRATITRAIAVLKEKGFLVILKSGTSNVYVINDDLAWSSWGMNRRYCKFPANVVLSASENQDYMDKLEQAKLKQLVVNEVNA